MGRFPDYQVSDKLDSADNQKNNDNRSPNHVAVPHLIAIPDTEIAQSSGSDGSCHGRNSNQADKGDHCDTGNPRDAFFQINSENDFNR